MPDGGPVVLINAFELPPEEEDERFLAGWKPSRDFLAQRAGYPGTAHPALYQVVHR